MQCEMLKVLHGAITPLWEGAVQAALALLGLAMQAEAQVTKGCVMCAACCVLLCAVLELRP